MSLVVAAGLSRSLLGFLFSRLFGLVRAWARLPVRAGPGLLSLLFLQVPAFPGGLGILSPGSWLLEVLAGKVVFRAPALKTEPSSRQVTLSTVGNCQRIPGFNGLETARAPTQELARSQVSLWQYFL